MRVNILSLPHAARLSLLGRLLDPPVNYEAVFSDETPEYLTAPPSLQGAVRVRLRLYKDQDADAFLVMNGEQFPMSKAYSAGYFDFYEAAAPVTGPSRYRFRIKTPRGEFFYGKTGVSEDGGGCAEFCVIPGFKTPDWVKGAVMYQIFVDRFRNGDTSNDPVNNEYAYLGGAAKHADWTDPVQNDDVCRFYGGDLQGVIDKLPYLKELGVEALYLNPIFVSPSSHKYDIQDYDHVDPHFGVIAEDGGEPLYFERFKNRYATKYAQRVTLKENLCASDALFAHMADEAHKLGIRVILDGVFNHCGAFNKWLDKEGFYERSGYPAGAYRDKNSPYAKFFKWASYDWPENENYDSWWGHKNHPKLNYEDSAELRDYILKIAVKWVSPPYNADGWRLDVAADLGYSAEFNHGFWQDFRKAVKTANPDAVILAEHYGDPSPWLNGLEWDTVMNYDAFMEPLTWFFCGVEKHSEEVRPELLNNAGAFLSSVRENMARLPAESLLTSMNQLSNHDHSRFLTRTGRSAGRLHTMGRKTASEGVDKSVMLLAVLVQMTWPGSPCIYYGDEAGLAGWTDPDNRRPYPWGGEDTDILNFHRDLIALRGLIPPARTGSFDFLRAENGFLCYSRTLRGDSLITAVNNSAEEITRAIPVWKLNIKNAVFSRILAVSPTGHTTEAARLGADGGFMSVTLPPGSGALFRYRDTDA